MNIQILKFIFILKYPFNIDLIKVKDVFKIMIIFRNKQLFIYD